MSEIILTPMPKQKNIALISHDNLKPTMIEWCRRNKAIFVDRLADRFRQWARVTDTGGAAIAHKVKTDVIEMRL